LTDLFKSLIAKLLQLLGTLSLKQDRKFVNMQSRNHAGVIDHAAKPVGSCADQGIASLVTITIIGRFQVIKINQRDRPSCPVRIGLSNASRNPSTKQRLLGMPVRLS
jgi:hypothetical protein